MANNNDLEDRVVYINRVSKAISGGSTFSFSTMVAVGNRDGKVGVGIGRDEEVPASIDKGRRRAEKELLDVPLLGNTIPHEIETTHDSARVLLKPASPGTGVIAGGAIRPIVELAGITDILTKSLGSDNPLNIARATMKALRQLRDPHRLAQLRGVSLEQLLEDNPFAGPVQVEEEEAEVEEEEQEVEEAVQEDKTTGETEDTEGTETEKDEETDEDTRAEDASGSSAPDGDEIDVAEDATETDEAEEEVSPVESS